MDIQEIIERYEAGESLASLGRKNNCDSRIIKSYLEKRNIHIRNRSEQTKITNIARTKSVNHNYFNEIDNNNKAWLLGFLTADGYITKNRNTISIGLSSTDEEILIKIKEELKIERTISHKETGNGFQVSTLEWSSQNQKEKLAQYGIVNNKTYKELHLPNFSNNQLTLAYILGYFDGDGSFSENNLYCRFRICSHRPELLTDIANFLNKQYKASFSLSQDKRGLYELSISTTYAKSIFNDMYNLNCLHLKRKYDKYIQWKEKFNF